MTDGYDAAELSLALLKGHALKQMAERQVTESQVLAVLSEPEDVLPVRAGRIVAQRVYKAESGRFYLLRVFIDVDRKPPEVVTIYRTSKIAKYRRR